MIWTDCKMQVTQKLLLCYGQTERSGREILRSERILHLDYFMNAFRVLFFVEARTGSHTVHH